MDRSTYQQKRKHFFDQIDHFWPDLYGEEYALYDVYEMNLDLVQAINTATKRIGSIFFKTATLLRRADDEVLLEMGFPKRTLSFLRLAPLSTESVIARLDLVQSDDEIKCLEINSDTPTFIKEVFHINELICQEFGLTNPNDGMERRLGKAIRTSIIGSFGLSKKQPNLVFTAHADHLEDRNTALYLQKLCGLPAKFVPLHRLQIERGVGLYDEAGDSIDVLYRQTFPIENLIEDQDHHGNPIGLWWLELVQLGKLKIINPPSAFLVQNKAVQAVIWGLHLENHSFFSGEEHQWIDKHFLPTFFEPDPFLETSQAFVKKPTFGREGDTVEIYDETGNLQMADSQTSYTEYVPIYQKYIDLPIIPFSTEKGHRLGHMIIGSFLINGQPSGIGARVGNPITDNLSHFLPIGVSKNP
ncbi:glutathionylspermidine synthase family protein [Bacillus sp. T3]|uniref:glutathionylspermidine synthase family protein n=1 Tax=Bacillus sp. T3 TaxID=467262 RepID=UPI0029814F91|nr:glutathionylspermidine synthase family protein [Bacillus sp. T3]